MGQFDRETDAALNELNWEAISETPGGEFAEVIGDLVALTATSGPLGIVGLIPGLLLKIRRLAGASYASNLVYAITAVRNDLETLYERHEDLRARIESLGTDGRFAEAISGLALRAMHTSVKDRLKRLARIVVNGVKWDELDPEGLDDMLRAATQLTSGDIFVLQSVAETQSKATIYSLSTGDGTINLPREVWQALEQDRFITPGSQMVIRSSLARLQSLGFVADIQTMESTWLPRFLVSPEGEKFLKFLREIAD
jgi:hypothetical protein